MRRIGLIMPSSDLSCELALGGVIDHRRSGATWRLRRVEWPIVTARDLTDLAAWRPDGVLCLDDEGWGLVEGLGVPVIRIRSARNSVVTFDEERIGAAAAEHLLERGVRRLGVMSREPDGWEGKRAVGFIAACERGGVSAERIPSTVTQQGVAAAVAWARAAAGPSGLFALHDWLAGLILDACADGGVDVPGRLAVIGADDVETWCEVTAVPLTSVRVPLRAAARAAAGLLDRVLDGEPLPRTPLRLPPLGVTVRASTALDTIDDPALRLAMACIAERATQGAGVARVVAASGIGRRALEKRFRARLGRSILQTIHRTRIDLALSLLAESRLSIPAVAKRCGFGDVSRFIAVCRAQAGATPSALLRSARR